METMTRDNAISAIEGYFDDGDFMQDLARRVAIRTESPEPERRPELYQYLTDAVSYTHLRAHET